MPFLTIKRFPIWLFTPEELGEIEREIMIEVSCIKELDITSDKVFVSIPVEAERPGDWWKFPTMEMTFAKDEKRTPAIKKRALDYACEVVFRHGSRKGVKEARAICTEINQDTQYIKYPKVA